MAGKCGSRARGLQNLNSSSSPSCYRRRNGGRRGSGYASLAVTRIVRLRKTACTRETGSGVGHICVDHGTLRASHSKRLVFRPRSSTQAGCSASATKNAAKPYPRLASSACDTIISRVFKITHLQPAHTTLCPSVRVDPRKR